MGMAKTSPAGTVLTSQEKYVTEARTQLMGQMAAFEPLLEKHMGQRVVVEISRGDKVLKISGLLREYTSEFIEIMDADYQIKESEPMQKSDLIIPRSVGVVRSLLK